MRVIVDNTELRVGFKHEELREPDGSLSWIHHKTTCTIWEITDPQKGIGDQEVIARGEAECCALDNFNKETGRKIALSRAIEQLALPKEERREIWTQYHGRATNGNRVETEVQAPREGNQRQSGGDGGPGSTGRVEKA